MEINFKTYHHGNVFLEYFSVVVLADYEKYVVDRSLQCNVAGQLLGTVKVVAVKPLLFKQLTDMLSFVAIGKPVHYLGKLLHEQAKAEGLQLHAQSIVQHLVLHYTDRNMQTLSTLMNEWWQESIITKTIQHDGN